MESVSAAAIGQLSAISTETVRVPYGASLASDTAAFESSLALARNNSAGHTDSVSEVAKAAFEPLDFLNKEAQSLAGYAKSAVESGNSMTPGEIVNLTVQSQKFMFHSQLTANIANRTADGVQQLFRQQG